MNTIIPTCLIPGIAASATPLAAGIAVPLIQPSADLSRRDFLRLGIAGSAGLVLGFSPRSSSAIQVGGGGGYSEPVSKPASRPAAKNEPPPKELSGLEIATIAVASAAPVALFVFYAAFNTLKRTGKRSIANATRAAEFAQLALSHQGAESEKFYQLSLKFANRIDPFLFKEYLESRAYLHRFGLRGDEVKILKPFYESAVKLIEELYSLWDTYLKSLPGNAKRDQEHLTLAKFFNKMQRPDLSVIHTLAAMPTGTDEGSAARDLEMVRMLDDVIKLFDDRELPPVFKSWLAGDAHTFLLRFLGRNASAYKGHSLFNALPEILERLVTHRVFDAVKSSENAPESLARFEKYIELIERNFVDGDPSYLDLAARTWEDVFLLSRAGGADTARLVDIKQRIIENHRRQINVRAKWHDNASYAAIADALHDIAVLRANAKDPDYKLVSELYETASNAWVDAGYSTKVIEDLCDAARHAELAGDRKRASRLRLAAVLDAKRIDGVDWVGAFSRISNGEGERRRAMAPLVPQIDTAGFEDIPVAAHRGLRPTVLASSTGKSHVAYHYHHHSQHYEPLRSNPDLMRRLYERPIFGGDMFAPPAEKQPYVLRLVLTQGCDYGACTFCSGYAGVAPHLFSRDEFRQHVDGVFAFLSQSADLRMLDLRRIFVGSGDAMGVPFEDLQDALAYAKHAFENATGRRSGRLSIYATTRSILRKTPEELGKLRQLLDLVYWGIESGSDEVLRFVKKGTSHGQMVEAAGRLNEAGIGISAMIMTGLGGVRFSSEHVVESARFLTQMNPKFITFMGINAGPDTAYARTMDEERIRGENRPLSLKESALQMADMIDRMTLPAHARAGSFPPDIDYVGRNAVPFPNTYMDNVRRENLVASLKLRAGILGATPETIVPMAVRALSDFVADEDQNILLRVYAAQLLGTFGAWAASAVLLLKQFERDYSSSGKIEAVSWAIEKIEASARKSTTKFPDNAAIAENIKEMPIPSDAYRRTGVNWLGDFLQGNCSSKF